MRPEEHRRKPIPSSPIVLVPPLDGVDHCHSATTSALRSPARRTSACPPFIAVLDPGPDLAVWGCLHASRLVSFLNQPPLPLKPHYDTVKLRCRACEGFVTLPCREREVSAPQELSGRCDCGPPRGHRDSAKRAVRVG